MALDFSDLIPEKPQNISFDDLIPQRASAASDASQPMAAAPTGLAAYNEPGTEASNPANETPQSGALSRITDAASQAWQDTPSLQTSEQNAWTSRNLGIVGDQIVNPAVRLVGSAPAAVHASMAALSQAAMELFGEKGGRDALALLSSLPMVHPELQGMRGRAEAPTTAPQPKFVSERFAPDVSELDPRNAMTQLIQHDIAENPPRGPDSGMANQSRNAPIATAADVMKASDLDSAIATARDASGVGAATADIGELSRSLAASEPAPALQNPATPGLAARLGTPEAGASPEASALAVRLGAPAPESVGAAASREGTPPGQIAPTPTEAATIRFQGEVERLASPPRPNDQAVYIPGTKPTLAEVTGDPRTAIDQKYNRQQPEAMQAHIDQENHNAGLVADYYADTAGSRPSLERLERAREERAETNKAAAFGAIDAERRPADPTPVIDLMDGILNSPEGQERNVIRKTIPDLIDRFYQEDGSLKTDPLSLYGIRKHIGDLLDGAGDPETSSSARVMRRELLQIREVLDDAIEQAAPGFNKYRQEYTRDSREIDAMKLLQDERLSLLNKDQHITPSKFFTFMKNIVEGRSDPMDPAAALSEEQMDRLWNISDHLKRSTFIDSGNPRGSPTSMLLEWGKRLGMHGAALAISPGLANIAVPFLESQLRARNVRKEMNRVLNPDIGQQGISP